MYYLKSTEYINKKLQNFVENLLLWQIFSKKHFVLFVPYGSTQNKPKEHNSIEDY